MITPEKVTIIFKLLDEHDIKDFELVIKPNITMIYSKKFKTLQKIQKILTVVDERIRYVIRS